MRGLLVRPEPENRGAFGAGAGGRAPPGNIPARAGARGVFHIQLSTPGAGFDPGPDLVTPGPDSDRGGSKFGPCIVNQVNKQVN